MEQRSFGSPARKDGDFLPGLMIQKHLRICFDGAPGSRLKHSAMLPGWRC
ncbi:hypothetical protein [Pseudarthrobacter sp. TAF60_1]